VEGSTWCPTKSIHHPIFSQKYTEIFLKSFLVPGPVWLVEFIFFSDLPGSETNALSAGTETHNIYLSI